MAGLLAEAPGHERSELRRWARSKWAEEDAERCTRSEPWNAAPETRVRRIALRHTLGYNLGKLAEEDRVVNRDRLLSRITVDPLVLVGKPTIRGMRVSVEQILDALAAGVSEEELLQDLPMLAPDDIRAALLYAREVVASERVYPVGGPALVQ